MAPPGPLRLWCARRRESRQGGGAAGRALVTGPPLRCSSSTATERLAPPLSGRPFLPPPTPGRAALCLSSDSPPGGAMPSSYPAPAEVHHLLRQASAELKRRLGQGEPCRVEDFFA